MAVDCISISNLPSVLSNNETESTCRGKTVSIQTNDDDANIKKNITQSSWIVIYVLSILGGSSIILSTFLLIPRHNSVIYQEYWYESNFIAAVALMLSIATNCIESNICLKLTVSTAIKFFVKLYLWTLIGWLTSYCLLYMFWVHHLGFNHPIPLLGLNMLLIWIWSIIGIWVVFPFHAGEEKEMRRTLIYYTHFLIGGFLLDIIGNDGLAFIYVSLPPNFEWLIAFIIPTIREIHYLAFVALVKRINGSIDKSITVYVTIGVYSKYGMFVALRLPDTSNLTMGSILAVELLLHLYSCNQIIKAQKRVGPLALNDGRMNMQYQNMIAKLIASEIIEALCPAQYALGLIMAYYGPNGYLLGNILNDWWHYVKIDDISNVLKTLLLLFLIDVANVLTSAAFFQICGNVYFNKEISKVLNANWLHFFVLLCNISYILFALNDINMGMDFTGSFNWTSREGRFQIICSSNDLTILQKAAILENATYCTMYKEELM